MKVCEICKQTEKDGFLDGNLTHCSGPRGCHRSWTGHTECHCGRCHRHFSNDAAFLAHQVDDECRDPGVLKKRNGEPRFRLEERKHGPTWVTISKGNFPTAAKRSNVAAFKRRALLQVHARLDRPSGSGR